MKAIIFIFLMAMSIILFTNCPQVPKDKGSTTTFVRGTYKIFDSFYEKIPTLQPVDCSNTCTISITYLRDDRIDDISKEQLNQLLRKTEEFAKKYLHLNVSLKLFKEEPILSFFKKYQPYETEAAFADKIASEYIDFHSLAGRKDVKETIHNDLEKRNLEDLRAYFPKDATIATMADAENYFYERFLIKLTDIYDLPNKSGGFFFQKDYYKTVHYTYWSTLLYNLKPEDGEFILTNSMMACADTGMPIYVYNRGGITNGMVDNNLHNSYKAAGFVGLQQFITKDDFFMKERGEIPDNDLIPTIAMLFTHELGHFLGRYREYYPHELQHSVNVAPTDLRIYEWYKDIINHEVSPDIKLETIDKY